MKMRQREEDAREQWLWKEDLFMTQQTFKFEEKKRQGACGDGEVEGKKDHCYNMHHERKYHSYC